MSDNRQSLSDLAELTGQQAAQPAPAAAAETTEATEATKATETPVADTGETAVAEKPVREGRGKDAPDDQGVSTQGPQIQAVLREQQLDKHGRAYATGRRKDAVARVWL